MARIGVSHLLAWYNSPNKINKINLTKKLYYCFQTYCYIKSSNKKYANGTTDVNNSLNCCYVADWGVIRTKYKIIPHLSVSTNKITIKDYAFVIGGNYVEIKYSDMEVYCIKQGVNMEVMMGLGYYLKPQLWPFNLQDNLCKLIEDVTSYAKEKESYFRELKNSQSNGASV